MEFQLHEPFLKTFVSNLKCVKLKLKNILTEVFLVFICLHGIICLNLIVQQYLMLDFLWLFNSPILPVL